MEMKNTLIDTNAYSHFLAGDKDIKSVLEESSKVFLSVVVIGELLIGYKSGSKEQKNRELLKTFINKPTVTVIHSNQETADIYSNIFLDLKNQGTPIPTNDIWIAAHAFETGSTLITYDKHFQNIPGLRVWSGIKGL